MSHYASVQVGGTVSHDKLYIRRAEDDLAYELLAERQYCSILTSRQMGKSSLMVRLMHRLRMEKSARTASIDIAGDIGTAGQASEWYISFLHKLSDDLELDVDINTWWNGFAGAANEKFLRFFRELICERISDQVYIFVDEIDATLKVPYLDDFFTVIRSMFNQRALVPGYERVTWCLIGVATPVEFIKDRRITPYNVGRIIELRDFNPKFDDFSFLYSLFRDTISPPEQIVNAVLDHTGGHPFMTMALCRIALDTHVRSVEAVNVLIRETVELSTKRSGRAVASPIQYQLLEHFETISFWLDTRMKRKAAAFRVYDAILRGKRIIDTDTAEHRDLRLAGIVKTLPDTRLVIRNKIYERRFGRDWLSRTQVMKERTIFARRVVVGAVLLSAVIGFSAYRVARRAEDAERSRRIAFLSWRLSEAEDDATAEWARIEVCGLMKLTNTDRERELSKAQSAWRAYSTKRGKEIEARAEAAVAAGDLDGGLLLGALASMKTGQPPSATLRAAYERSYAPHLRMTLRGNVGAVNKVRFLAQNHLVSVGEDGTLRLFDLKGARETGREVLLRPARALAICPDQSCIITASDRSDCQMRQVLSNSPGNPRFVADIGKGVSTINAIAIMPAPYGWRVAVGGGSAQTDFKATATIAVSGLLDRGADVLMDPRIVQHSAANGRVAEARALSFLRDGAALILATRDDVCIVDWTVSGQRVERIFGQGAVDLRVSTDETRAVIGMPGRCLVYSIVSRALIATFRRDGQTFIGAQLAQDGEQVVTCANPSGGNSFLHVWSVSDPQHAETTEIPRARDIDADAGPGSRNLIVTGHEDGAIRVWSMSGVDEHVLFDDVDALWAAWQIKFGYTVGEDAQLQDFSAHAQKRQRSFSTAVCEPLMSPIDNHDR